MSGSGPSDSFELLAEPVRRWIWLQKWRELHDIQERAIPVLLRDDTDAILAAPTAVGKTEAAFLPLISAVITKPSRARGFDLLYVSPLRALINDQFRRLRDLCETVNLPVHAWHGDIASSRKSRALRNPRGVLLITPESLEAMFVLRGSRVPGLFGGLRGIVIDELHALLGTERGVHTRSLLTRLEIAAGRRVRRVGLSATLGDMGLAACYLRPEQPDAVAVLESTEDSFTLSMQLRGYEVALPSGSAPSADADDAGQAASPPQASAERQIAEHMFQKLRGTTNLVFAGSRQSVELFSDLLRRKSERERVPNEFFPHHASLSAEHRAFVEERLKRKQQPTTAVCTSTLELGIDIGDVRCVGQINAPFSVSSLRQRLGRSGRRKRPAELRMYVLERSATEGAHPADSLRLRLVRSVAMVELLRERWCESPADQALHLSTLLHQILSVVAEKGGATASQMYSTLCERGPFKLVDKTLFGQVLRRMGAPDVALLEQSRDGVLLPGREGERVLEHYSFYAVFETPSEYRVLHAGRTLGTIPEVTFFVVDMTIIFSGRRWRITAIDHRDKVIEVASDLTGRPPTFGGDAGEIADEVVRRMREIFESESVPGYLDAKAAELLREGRGHYRRLGLLHRRVVKLDSNRHLVATWAGTVRNSTFALALGWCGFETEVYDGFIGIRPKKGHDVVVSEAIRRLADGLAPTGEALLAETDLPRSEKYHRYLSRDLLMADTIASRLLPSTVPEMAREIRKGGFDDAVPTALGTIPSEGRG